MATREAAIGIVRESMNDARLLIDDQIGNGASFCIEYQVVIASLTAALVQARLDRDVQEVKVETKKAK